MMSEISLGNALLEEAAAEMELKLAGPYCYLCAQPASRYYKYIISQEGAVAAIFVFYHCETCKPQAVLAQFMSYVKT